MMQELDEQATRPTLPPRRVRGSGAGWLPLVALADGVIVAGSFLGCYSLRFVQGWVAPAPAPPLGPYLHGSLLVALVWTAALAGVGLYDARRPGSRFDDAVLTVTGLGLGGVLTAGLAGLYRSFSYSRLVFFYAWVASLVLLLAFHLILRGLQTWGRAHGVGVRRTLVLGHNALGIRVAHRLAQHPHGRVVLGLVALDNEQTLAAPGLTLLGRRAQLFGLIDALGVDEVVVAWPEASPGELGALLRELGTLPGVGVRLVPDGFAELAVRVEATSVDGLPMLAVNGPRLRDVRHRAAKRGMDLVLASVGLVLALPLMLLVALAIKATSPGPIFYAQERLGRDGHRFTIYKFRSMGAEAEPLGPVWTRREDDRATPLGAILRRYSLDELPQLWNVLKGDMSLVGPRPERPFFVEQFRESVPRYMDRHLARSGLTGWAQVNGLRGDVDIADRTRYDIQYVENWSVLLDLRILVLTIAAIFRRPGY